MQAAFPGRAALNRWLPRSVHAEPVRAAASPAWTRRPTWIAWAGAAITVLMLIVTVAHFIDERERARERQLDRLALYARMLEDQLARSFDSAALVLDTVLAAANPNGAGNGLPTPAELARSIATQPFVRSLAILDGRGVVLSSSRASEVGLTIPLNTLNPKGLPRKDRIGSLIPFRTLDEMVQAPKPTAGGYDVSALPLIRAINLPQGTGVAVVLINPLAIENMMRLATSESGVSVTLANFEGVSLVSSHAQELPPIRISENPIFVRLASGQENGLLVTPGLLDGSRTASAYRASSTRPLLTIVERPLRQVDAAWIDESRLRLAVAGAALVAVALLTGYAYRSSRARLAAQAGLVRQLRFTEQLFDLSPLPIAMLDRDGHYLQVNRAWEAFMGRTREQVLGTSSRANQPPAQARRHEEVDRALLAGGPPVQYQERQWRADGTQREVVINKVAVPGPNGRPQGVLKTFADITELQEAERATREARDAAQEAARAKDEFIANISHELRTPLQSIIGFSELGMIRARSDGRVMGMFTDIHASGQRMLALVNDLLDVSKIESSVGTIHLESTDLRPLVREVVQELQPLLLGKGLRLDTQIDDHRVLARVDPMRFQQVVRNVIANALKFSPQGAAVEITLRRDRIGGSVFTVRDHGPGIPPLELAAIFDAFVQSSRTKDGSGGTGLGLSISRKIVEAHGGTIRAENAADGGARFIVSMPPRAASATDVGPVTN